jgi:hypothetical protein
MQEDNDNNTPIEKAKFYVERSDPNDKSDFAVICRALVDSELKQATGLENNIIIYAKGWYGHTNNVVEDVRELMSLYSSTDLKYIPARDAKCYIISTFCNYVPDYARPQALERGLGLEPFEMMNMDIYVSMLSKLAIIEGKLVNMDKKLDLTFKKRYVIKSTDEDGYWSNITGWVDKGDATVFSHDERRHFNLPNLPTGDGEWVEYLADPDNDEFLCVKCGKVKDIEDSIKAGEELICVNCSE